MREKKFITGELPILVDMGEYIELHWASGVVPINKKNIGGAQFDNWVDWMVERVEWQLDIIPQQEKWRRNE